MDVFCENNLGSKMNLPYKSKIGYKKWQGTRHETEYHSNFLDVLSNRLLEENKKERKPKS